jgi:hypothetical protein
MYTVYILLDQTYPDYLDLAIIAEGRRYEVQHLRTEIEGGKRQLTLRMPGVFEQLEGFAQSALVVLQSHVMVHPQPGDATRVAVYYKEDDPEDIRSRLEKLL